MGTRTWNEVNHSIFLVTWLGTPPARCFEGLPHWPGRLPQVAEAKPWPSQAQPPTWTSSGEERAERDALFLQPRFTQGHRTTQSAEAPECNLAAAPCLHRRE